MATTEPERSRDAGPFGVIVVVVLLAAATVGALYLLTNMPSQPTQQVDPGGSPWSTCGACPPGQTASFSTRTEGDGRTLVVYRCTGRP